MQRVITTNNGKKAHTEFAEVIKKKKLSTGKYKKYVYYYHEAVSLYINEEQIDTYLAAVGRKVYKHQIIELTNKIKNAALDGDDIVELSEKLATLIKIDNESNYDIKKINVKCLKSKRLEFSLSS